VCVVLKPYCISRIVLSTSATACGSYTCVHVQERHWAAAERAIGLPLRAQPVAAAGEAAAVVVEPTTFGDLLQRDITPAVIDAVAAAVAEAEAEAKLAHVLDRYNTTIFTAASATAATTATAAAAAITAAYVSAVITATAATAACYKASYRSAKVLLARASCCVL
jgi:hypothetical protein